MTSVNICGSAREKLHKRGIQVEFVHMAFRHGDWFHDKLDCSIMHCRYHGHEVICRHKYDSLFVITVNTDVKKEHAMVPMESPYCVLDTADTSNNWRRAQSKLKVEQIPGRIASVLKIAERIIGDHRGAQ